MRQFYGKSTGAEEFSLPVLLQADTDSTSVYLGMIADQSGVTFDNADSLQVILHIED
jgi:acetyl-CoA carboxylase alpha subunit